MSSLFIEYPKCTTCQKAKKWLDEQGISYDDRHIVEQNPTAEELRSWIEGSGLPAKKFFNTSGLLYKSMKLKDQLADMSLDEQIALLASNGMLLIPAMPQITRTKLGAANFGPWENIVRVLILVWFMLYTLNAIPDIHPLVGRIAAKVNYWISYFFMFEYILRVLCAKPRKAYIFSGMGILDFIVCVPFLGMFFGTDWQILYSLRIVRILAIFKLARFNETAASFKKAFYLIRDEFFLFFSVILFMLYVTSLGIYIAEHDAQPEKFGSFFDALWFAVETLSTVGYGDLVPITPMGRIFTGVIMFIAVSIIAISTGLITSAFSRVWQQENVFAHRHKRDADKVAAEAGEEEVPK